MSLPRPKTIVDDYLAALRASTETYLSQLVFRKGPQHTVKLPVDKVGVGFVRLEGMPGGEQGAGSGNVWRHPWSLRTILAIPDDISDPEGCEDLRLDILGDFLEFIQDTRCVSEHVKTGRLVQCDLVLAPLAAEQEQVWRCIDAIITYSARRS